MKLIDRIAEYNGFSDVETTIRDYVLKNINDISNMSIYDLAKETYTSPATIVRFCRRLGLEGFKDFKLKIIYDLVKFEPKDYQHFDLSNIAEGDSPGDVFEKVTTFIHNAIDETYSFQDPEDLYYYAKLIRDAEIVDFYGVGSSNTVAMDAIRKFMACGKAATASESYEMQRFTALNSDKNHLAIIISYTGETEQMLNIAGMLKENGTPTISITRYDSNSLKKITDYHINVSLNESTFRPGASASRIASLYIIDVLCSLYVSLDYQKTVRHIIRSRVPQAGDDKLLSERAEKK